MFERKSLDWGEGKTSFIEIFDNPNKPGFQFAHATGFNALVNIAAPLVRSCAYSSTY